MSILYKIGLGAGFVAIAAANIADPSLIPYTVGGGLTGGGVVAVAYYVKNRKSETQAYEPLLQKVSTLLSNVLKKPFWRRPDSPTPTQAEPLAYHPLPPQSEASFEILKLEEQKHSLEELVDVPAIIMSRDGWKAEGCEGTPQRGIYKFIIDYLSKNPALIVARDNSLRDIARLDITAKFYYSEDKHKICVVAEKVPKDIEELEPYGASYIVGAPPSNAVKLEPVVKGVFTGKHVYLENPIEGSSVIIESINDVMKYLQKGVTLYLRAEEQAGQEPADLKTPELEGLGKAEQEPSTPEQEYAPPQITVPTLKGLETAPKKPPVPEAPKLHVPKLKPPEESDRRKRVAELLKKTKRQRQNSF